MTKGSCRKFRISYPGVPEAEALNFPSSVSVCVNGSSLNVNNTNYVKNMLRLGFRIGRNSDNAKNIAASLPEGSRDEFWSGFEFATKVAA